MILVETYTSHKKGPDDNYIITCTQRLGIPILWRIFGYKEETVEYYGSSTVWRNMNGFKRCGTFTEGWLSDVYASIKYEESQKRKKVLNA